MCMMYRNLAPEAQQVNDGEDSEKKDIKKKKKKHRDQHSEADIMNEEIVLLADRKVKLNSKMKDGDADDDCRVRKLPNGLTIEQLDKGNPDGKVVAPGKKVSCEIFTGVDPTRILFLKSFYAQ